MSHVHIFLGCLALCCIVTWFRGGAPERVAALILLFGTLASMLVAPQSANGFNGFMVGLLLVDAAMFVAACGLAVCANRFWPMWLAALLGFGLYGHLLKFLLPGTWPLVYWMTQFFSSYPALILLMVAVRRHRLRVIATGADEPWSSCFSRWVTSTRR